MVKSWVAAERENLELEMGRDLMKEYKNKGKA